MLALIGLGEGEALRIWLILALFLPAVLISGCVSVGAGEGTGGSGMKSRWYAGVVRVRSPDRQDGLSAVDVRTFGAGWDGGPWLGWQAGNWVVADPGRCQLLIIIRSPAEARNARSVIAALRGKEACVADFAQAGAPGGGSRRK